MRSILLLLLLLSNRLNAQHIITTYAGGGTTLGDGNDAKLASLGFISGIAFDSWGNLFIADGNNNRIRKVDATTNIISTVVGNGVAGFTGDYGQASSATLNNPSWIFIDKKNNIFITDAGNYRVRRVDATTGIIKTIVGNGSNSYSGDNGPAIDAAIKPQDIVGDNNGNLYISDGGNQRIRKVNSSGIITTIAGNGTIGFSGDNGPATVAQLSGTYGVCLNTNGDIYISDGGNHRIRKISATNGIISTIVGNGTNTFNGENIPAIGSGIDPFDVVVDSSDNIYIADFHNHRIRRVDVMGSIQTIAGNGINGFGGDGSNAIDAKLSGPEGVAISPSNFLFISDFGNKRVRKLNSKIYTYVSTDNILYYSIHPNPSNQILHIDNLHSTANYRLLNTVGAIQQQGLLKAGSNSIDISLLSSGMYMLEVSSEDGKRSVSKVIKQ